MNTVIIYSSKYGTTKDCAKYLKSKMSGSAVLFNIDKSDIKELDLESCGTVILGSSIYIGSVSKKLRGFCNSSLELLRKKKVGIFICCGFVNQGKEYLLANFPSDLLSHAISVKVFGGEVRPEKMKAVDRLIMKAAAKGKLEDLKISDEAMDAFIDELEE